MMYCRGPSEKALPPIMKLIDGMLSTAPHPAATRQVFVSGEYTIPGIACADRALSTQPNHAMTAS